jgi:hypothetical protein
MSTNKNLNDYVEDVMGSMKYEWFMLQGNNGDRINSAIMDLCQMIVMLSARIDELEQTLKDKKPQ